MSSGGGPRATGSGLAQEGKFRQRVDTHYKVMAEAKKSIRTAGNLQMASALLLGTIAGLAATLPESIATIMCGVSVALMLVTGACARAASAASGAKDAEKHAASYGSWMRMLGGLLLLAAAGVGGAVFAELELPSLPITAAAGSILLLDLVSCIIGLSSSSKLLAAFEDQRKKSKAM